MNGEKFWQIRYEKRNHSYFSMIPITKYLCKHPVLELGTKHVRSKHCSSMLENWSLERNICSKSLGSNLPEMKISPEVARIVFARTRPCSKILRPKLLETCSELEKSNTQNVKITSENEYFFVIYHLIMSLNNNIFLLVNFS